MSSVFSLSAAAVDSIVFLINDIFEKGDPKPDRLFYGFGVVVGSALGVGVGFGVKSTHSCVSHCPASLSPRAST